jgi:hypothetical protein
LGDVKVRVNVSNLLIIPNPTQKPHYRKGEEYICTESDAKSLGQSVTILEYIPEPIPELELEKPVRKFEKRSYKK